MRVPVCAYVASDGSEIVLCSDGSAWVYNEVPVPNSDATAWMWEEENPIPGSVRDVILNDAVLAPTSVPP